MTSIGECLRRERLRRSLQLEQISGELKISARMLAAIEAEEFGKLPGGVFTKSFVRQYAHYLGLDEDEMVAEVDRVLRPEQSLEIAKPDVSAVPLPRMDGWQTVGDGRSPMSGWSSSLPALILVVVVMLVCSAVWAFLQRPKHVTASNPDRAVPQTTAAAPAVAQPIVPVSQRPQAAPSRPEAQQPLAPAVPTEQSAEPGPTVALAQHAEAIPATPLTLPAVRSQSADAPATAPGPVHVEISAAEPVWIRATSDGKVAFTGTLAANQTRTVDANENVLLRLGSAGSVAIALNGKPIGPVGPKGQVRNVQLTSGGFQIVAAPSSAPLDPL